MANHDNENAQASSVGHIADYDAPEWTCGGCGTTAPAHSDGWRFTDAAWCPRCGWLA